MEPSSDVTSTAEYEDLEDECDYKTSDEDVLLPSSGNESDIEMRQLGGTVREEDEDEGDGEEVSKLEQDKFNQGIRLINLIVVFATVTTAEASRGIVVPSLGLYNTELGGSPATLSAEVSVFSVGRLISAPLLGWLSGRYVSDSRLLGTCLAICVFGNFLYGLGLEIGLSALVISRLILGFATGILGVARAFVSLVTTQEERTGYQSLLNAVQFVGFSLTPMLGSILCGLDFSVLGIQVNCFSAPGFLLCLMNVVMLGFFLAFFRDPARVPTGSSNSSSNDSSSERNSWSARWLGPTIFIALNAVVRGSISVLETIGGGMFRTLWKDEDNDELEDTGYFFTGIGCIGVVSYIIVSMLSKKVSDYAMLIVGLLCIALGSCLLITIGESDFWRFVIGSILIWSCGMPLTGTCVVSMCSKIITPAQQGTVMGLVTAAGSIGRIIGPVIAVLPKAYCFASVFSCVMLSLVVSIFLRKQMLPQAVN